MAGRREEIVEGALPTDRGALQPVFGSSGSTRNGAFVKNTPLVLLLEIGVGGSPGSNNWPLGPVQTIASAYETPTKKNSEDARLEFPNANWNAPPPPPPAAGGKSRIAWINNHHENKKLKYPNNSYTTAKYSFITFLPKTLFEQFRRVANLYFLLISALQLFTTLSPTSKYTTAGPFAAVMAFTLIREAYEDSRRHAQDRQVNNRLVWALASSSGGAAEWTRVKWRSLVVGDIVKVEDSEEIPADLVLLSSTGDQGMCYIDTANLDGETNLKIKSSLPQSLHIMDAAGLGALAGHFEYEQPNDNVHGFVGKVALEKGLFPVNFSEILLRGARLRNTKFIHGFVVFTGVQTKLAKNASRPRSKRSNIEKLVNLSLAFVFSLQLLICVVCTVCMHFWVKDFKSSWYLPFLADHSLADTLRGFITFFILFNNFLPLSLYISVEVVKMFQALFMQLDLSMYHDETDTPMQVRTTNLNEELGQVPFVISFTFLGKRDISSVARIV